MNYYKIDNGKLQITNSSFELSAPWIQYELGQEPIELKEALEIEAKEVELQVKISEAKQYLSNTDYKVLPDYDKTENIEEIKAKRQEARELIRRLENA